MPPTLDVAAWLRELKLEQYDAAFRSNAVDGEVHRTCPATAATADPCCATTGTATSAAQNSTPKQTSARFPVELESRSFLCWEATFAPHQRRWGFAGPAAPIDEGGPTAVDCDDTLPPLKRNAAATLKTAMAPRAHQPNQDCFATCDQKPAATRGGVIARVWRSIRQKSNRPLWPM